MGSKKDKKKEKRRRSEAAEAEETTAAMGGAKASSAAAASASGGGGGEGKRCKVSVQLAKGVPSADSREQDAADPLVVPPILATFPHGPPKDPQALRFRCRASAASGTGQRGRRRLQLTAETAHVAYEGEGPAVARKTKAKYVVGVYSKSRQALSLYPVEALLAMGQRVNGLQPQVASAGGSTAEGAGARDGGLMDESGGGAGMSYAERRKSLVETFGTKKKRRVMQSQEENRIRAEGVVGLGALGGFLADSRKEVKEEAAAQGAAPSAAEATRAGLLPPYDANARSADRVYSARRILPGADAWEGLEMDVQQLAAGVAGDGEAAVDAEALRSAVLAGWKHWPAFLRGRVQDAPMPTAVPAAGSGGDARWEHLCALMLLRHLLDLHRLPPTLKGGAGALAKMLGNGQGEPCNELVAEACLAAFFQQQGEGGARFTRTKPLTDKLLLHVLVLCLIVGGYRVSATKIAQDLRMSPGDCATLFRETGATVKRVYGGGGGSGEEATGGGKRGGRGGDEVQVELALPLRFPEVKRGMRQTKK